MEYEKFMFDEAFDFHNKNEIIKITTPEDDADNGTTEVKDQRLPPLGACSNDEHTSSQEGLEMQNHMKLQEQHEQLNSSLFALTSHFAQVQFRLKQIIHGPKLEQEKLLGELEEFAFAGCPDVLGPSEKAACPTCVSHTAIKRYENTISDEQEREKRLDTHLKNMLSELEHCQKQFEKGMKKNKGKQFSYSQAKLTGDTYAFEEMEQLELSDDEPDKVPEEDIKKYVDKTMAKLINPRKAKDNIIAQVSKQIHDMEKFVNFLQSYESTTEVETDCEPTSSKRATKSKNTASGDQNRSRVQQKHGKIPAPHTRILELSQEKRKRLHDASVAVMKKGLAVLQIFAISQFGCSARHFQEHMMRKAETATVSSTGHKKPLNTLRSCIDQMMMLHTKLVDVGGLHPDSEDELNLPISSSDKRASWRRTSTNRMSRERSRTSSVSSVSSVVTAAGKSIENSIQEDLIRLVRGDFTMALKELMQHGLFSSFQSSGLSTKALVGCMSSHTGTGHGLHIWEYISYFYKLKQGDRFNTQPSMMLSEAFAMDIGCTQQTPKQSLLTVLHRIKSTHESRKRSFDAMFKALVSAGLNRGRLAQWIRLVVRSPELVDRHYERWSFVVKTGFDEVLTLLEKLSTLTFFLPEDLAIRHLLKSANEFGDA